MTKDPKTQEIPRVLGALGQEPVTKTKYIVFIVTELEFGCLLLEEMSVVGKERLLYSRG